MLEIESLNPVTITVDIVKVPEYVIIKVVLGANNIFDTLSPAEVGGGIVCPFITIFVIVPENVILSGLLPVVYVNGEAVTEISEDDPCTVEVSTDRGLVNGSGLWSRRGGAGISRGLLYSKHPA